MTPSLAIAATVHVSPAGSGGTNLANCKAAASGYATGMKTINAGLDCLLAGEANLLLIDDGIYPESISAGKIKSGASDSQRTIIRARNNRKAVIRPNSGGCAVTSNNTVLNIVSGQRFIELDGIVLDGNNVCVSIVRFDNFATNGLLTHIRIKNSTLRYATGYSGGSAMINGGGSALGPENSVNRLNFNHIDLIDNIIHDMPDGGSPIGNSCVSVDPTDSLWEGNFVYNCAGHGMTSHHTGNQTGLTVRNNVIKFAKAGCFQFSALDHRIYNNLCLFTGAGFKLSGERFASGALDIVDSNESGLTTQIRYWNNTVYGTHDGGGDIPCMSVKQNASQTEDADNEFRNIICDGPGVGSISLNQLGSGAAVDPAPVLITHTRCATGCTTSSDPEFVDSAAFAACDSYAACVQAAGLRATSPLRDVGVDLGSVFASGPYPMSPPTDLHGVARPQGIQWDYGALEFLTQTLQPDSGARASDAQAPTEASSDDAAAAPDGAKNEAPDASDLASDADDGAGCSCRVAPVADSSSSFAVLAALLGLARRFRRAARSEVSVRSS